MAEKLVPVLYDRNFVIYHTKHSVRIALRQSGIMSPMRLAAGGESCCNRILSQRQKSEREVREYEADSELSYKV